MRSQEKTLKQHDNTLDDNKNTYYIVDDQFRISVQGNTHGSFTDKLNKLSSHLQLQELARQLQIECTCYTFAVHIDATLEYSSETIHFTDRQMDDLCSVYWTSMTWNRRLKTKNYPYRLPLTSKSIWESRAGRHRLVIGKSLAAFTYVIIVVLQPQHYYSEKY